MTRTIRLQDDVFQRLQALAVPLIDTTEDVVLRLLDFHDQYQGKKSSAPHSRHAATSMFKNTPTTRYPRQRGALVKLDGSEIRAESVSDLYEQALRYLVANGHESTLLSLLPVSTSKKRYLLSDSPKHPTGKHFVSPVKYRRFYMEAHKDYKNALRHLESRILDPCGVTLEYLA